MSFEFWKLGNGVLVQGDCDEVLPIFPPGYFSAMVTDPPYGLSFMGKKWDYDVPARETWKRGLDALRPGAHALIFAGSRTQHRMAVNVEDAGFTLKDTLMWIYGSGFPKSTDISKQIDKDNGKCKIDLKSFGAWIRKHRKIKRFSRQRLDVLLGTNTAVSWWEGRKSGVQLPGLKVFNALKIVLDLDNSFDNLIEWAEAEREVIETRVKGGSPFAGNHEGQWNDGQKDGEFNITVPATPEAELWNGWKSHLKPAYEPILLVMKPNDGSYVANALKHGVAGLNVDECRIPGDMRKDRALSTSRRFDNNTFQSGNPEINPQNPGGRYPANVIFDEESARMLDEQSGHGANSGGASRFFYCVKASRNERGERNKHLTVKPLKLMEYLCRLVGSPRGTVILDPFAGSGTTALACERLGYSWLAIEREPEYCEIIKRRIASEWFR